MKTMKKVLLIGLLSGVLGLNNSANILEVSAKDLNPVKTEEEQRNEIADSCKETINHPDNGASIILDLNENINIDDVLLPDSKVVNKIDMGYHVRYYIDAPKNILLDYVELYRNSEIPDLICIDVSVPTIPSLPAETDIVGCPLGDMNADGKVDVTDLTELSLALLGDTELTSSQQKAADVDGSGDIKLTDLATLKQYLSKQIESLG